MQKIEIWNLNINNNIFWEMSKAQQKLIWDFNIFENHSIKSKQIKYDIFFKL